MPNKKDEKTIKVNYPDDQIVAFIDSWSVNGSGGGMVVFDNDDLAHFASVHSAHIT